ncbi:hypothetical protein GCM10020254_28190 [Streptomyces goshikiensis]
MSTPRAEAQLPKADADALAKKIKDAGKPVFVAVLPANGEFPAESVLRAVRAETGITGLYAIRLGDGFDAGADRAVMPANAVRNLTDAVKVGSPDAVTQLNNFVDQALTQVKGGAPASWGGSGADTGAPVGGLITLGAVAAVGGTGAYLLVRRNRRQKEETRREAVERLRVVVDEDITAFGEELDRLDFHPGEPGADDAMRKDYEQGLDSYEKAKQIMGSVRYPEEVKGVTQALEDGRFALASLDARRRGAPLPERRSPCFFDPRHGPSTEDAQWAPAGGSARTVPVCAADAVRLRDGLDPAVRTVDTEHGPRPYYDAGPAYGPWAGGYFGGRHPARAAGGHDARFDDVRPRLRLRLRRRQRLRRRGRLRGRFQPVRLRRRGLRRRWRLRRGAAGSTAGAASSAAPGPRPSGLLDRRDVEGQLHLVADHHAAGLQRGVPGQAPVGAQDLGGALEADALVAVDVGGGAVEFQVDGERPRDALDRQVTGDAVRVAAQLVRPGGAEAHQREGLGVEEVAAAQVGVAVGDAGVHGGDPHVDGGGGAGGVRAVQVEGALVVGEAAAHVGDHRVADGEADAAVGGVDDVVTGERGQGPGPPPAW